MMWVTKYFSAASVMRIKKHFYNFTTGACIFEHYEFIIYGKLSNFVVWWRLLAWTNTLAYYWVHTLQTQNVLIVHAQLQMFKKENFFSFLCCPERKVKVFVPVKFYWVNFIVEIRVEGDPTRCCTHGGSRL